MELGLLSFTKGAPLLELVVEPNMGIASIVHRRPFSCVFRFAFCPSITMFPLWLGFVSSVPAILETAARAEKEIASSGGLISN
jgi:hypothetical protein